MRDGKRFWMVVGENRPAPTKKHDSHKSALTEARRLSQSNQGTIFYILVAEKAVTLYTVEEWGLY